MAYSRQQKSLIKITYQVNIHNGVLGRRLVITASCELTADRFSQGIFAESWGATQISILVFRGYSATLTKQLR